MTNPCFLRMVLNVTSNVINKFFEHGFAKKICVLFCRFSFCIFSWNSHAWMFDTLLLIVRSFDSEAMPGRLFRKARFAKPLNQTINLSEQLLHVLSSKLCLALKFYTSVERRLKLIVRRFLGLIPTFVEVTGKKTGRGGGAFCLPILNRVN